MASTKFFGKVGYGEEIETAPGVWSLVVTEREYYGDVKRNTRRLQNGDKVNEDISVGNSIEIVADAYAADHFFAIKYVMWAGTRWEVPDVEVLPGSPRLLLRLGGVYNGDTPATP